MLKLYVLCMLLFISSLQDASDVELGENTIFYSEALLPFLYSLEKLDSGQKDKVSIVHIGDSHIQADFFSGTTRKMMQERFGNGGRGFVFPYALAGTSGAIDVCFSSSQSWNHCDIMKDFEGCNLGLAGYNVRGKNQQSFTVDTRSRADTDADFTRLKIFNQGAIFLPEEMSGEYTISQTSDRLTEVQFDIPQDSIALMATCDDERTSANLQGVVFENNQPGILYHAVGVNGSSTRQYLRSESYAEQMADLDAELVIISYGTNDCYMYSSKFCIDCVKDRFRRIIKQIREENPSVSILLTSPPDSYIYRKYANQNISKLQKAMQELCFEQNVALWDLYRIMGGKYSIKKWYAEGLARRDYIHFTRAGYELQGQLLYEAIVKAYEGQDDA